MTIASSRIRALAGCALAATFFLSSFAVAQDAVSVSIAIKNHRFQPAEIKAPANRPIVIKVKNLDATPEEFESVSLRVEKVIAGNSEGLVRIRALTPGRYHFFGDFHQDTAQGTLVVQ